MGIAGKACLTLPALQIPVLPGMAEVRRVENGASNFHSAAKRICLDPYYGLSGSGDDSRKRRYYQCL